MLTTIVEESNGRKTVSSLTMDAGDVLEASRWLADATGATVDNDGRWCLSFPETVEDSLMQSLQKPSEAMNAKQTLALLDRLDEAINGSESIVALDLAHEVLDQTLATVDWETLLLTTVYIAVRRSGSAAGQIACTVEGEL